MFDHPTAAELIAAARMQLEQQVIPSIAEPRLRFQTLVAANVLAIVERELAAGEAHLAAAWRRVANLEGDNAEQPSGEALRSAVEAQTRRLCQAIRAGAYDERPARQALLAHLRRTAEDELAVANPRFLERIRDKT
ncbi:MAG TPA: DUF6285 domain-containing protein [Roseiflexaceae bacterium]|nr:DUF6285 domain-containing protein [Roseiflexaceae bacterium]